jgi:hypothetical protein
MFLEEAGNPTAPTKLFLGVAEIISRLYKFVINPCFLEAAW